MRDRAEEKQAYLARLRPMLNGLFAAAHAAAGNVELAEYALQSAILSTYLVRGDHERVGLREGLLRAVRRAALQERRAHPNAEFDWGGLKVLDDSLILRRIAEKPVESQRAMALRYGAGMGIRDISEVMGVQPDELREDIRQICARVERDLREIDISRVPVERTIARELRRALNRPEYAPIDAGSIFRAFEQDAESAHRPRRILRKTLRVTFGLAAALLAAALFWLFAILLEG